MSLSGGIILAIACVTVPNRHIVPPNMSRAFYTAGTVCGFD
jgi:hypothetical protein